MKPAEIGSDRSQAVWISQRCMQPVTHETTLGNSTQKHSTQLIDRLCVQSRGRNTAQAHINTYTELLLKRPCPSFVSLSGNSLSRTTLPAREIFGQPFPKLRNRMQYLREILLRLRAPRALRVWPADAATLRVNDREMVSRHSGRNEDSHAVEDGLRAARPRSMVVIGGGSNAGPLFQTGRKQHLRCEARSSPAPMTFVTMS